MSAAAIIGARIRQARERRGLSQAELGRMIGRITGTPITGSAVGYYESGQRQIRLDDLQLFARVLGVEVSYFLEGTEFAPPPKDGLTAVLLRATAMLNPTAKSDVEGFVTYVRSLEGGEPVPPIIESIKGAPADRLLRVLGIAEPPVDPRRVAEAMGIKVVEWKFEEAVSGALVVDGNKRVIGVNVRHAPVRKRFTIAHELGHYWLDHYQDIAVDVLDPWTDTNSDPVAERQANAWAASLLMPEEFIRREVDRGIPFGALAKRFDVSEQAMWIRLVEVGLAKQYA